MTFSVVQKVLGSDGVTGSITTLTLTIGAVVSGNAVMGEVMYAAASIAAPTSVKIGTNTLVVKNHLFDSTNTNGVFMYEGVLASGGSTSMIVTWPASPAVSVARAEMIEVSGVGAFDVSTAQIQTNIGTAVTSGTATPSQSGDFLYGAGAQSTGGSSETYTAGSGYTIENNSVPTIGTPNVAIADEVQFPYNSVVAIAATFTITDNPRSHYTGIMAFTAAAAAACPRGLSLMGIGCSLGWRAARAIERNDIVSRRGLILPTRFF